MQIEIENISTGTVLIRLPFENLDAGNVKAFRDAMQPLLDKHSAVLIDMGSLNFVDSSGLGAFLSCLRAMNEKSGQMRLFAMTKPVSALFELVRMNRIFAIVKTKEEALEGL